MKEPTSRKPGVLTWHRRPGSCVWFTRLGDEPPIEIHEWYYEAIGPEPYRLIGPFKRSPTIYGNTVDERLLNAERAIRSYLRDRREYYEDLIRLWETPDETA